MFNFCSVCVCVCVWLLISNHPFRFLETAKMAVNSVVIKIHFRMYNDKEETNMRH